MPIKNRFSITDVAKIVGVTPRTIMRWEKSGKIKKSKRDWRGWRFYSKEEIEGIKKFYETAYEFNGFDNQVEPSRVAAVGMAKSILLILGSFAALCAPLYITLAQTESSASSAEVVTATDNKSNLSAATPSTKASSVSGVKETAKTMDVQLDKLPARGTVESKNSSPVTYTLGPDDVIAIDVRRHAEFSGQFTVNSEGKIEYKYVGDVNVTGLTKDQLKERLTEMLSDYLVSPEIEITIVAYMSKVFYVVGEVGRPGKFFMKGNNVNVREALVQAGLPTHAAAMRRSRLITPDKQKKDNYKEIDVYSLLYQGNLQQDFVMKPGDVLYVPATVMAKILRVIMPISDTSNEITSLSGPAAAAF